MGPSDSTAAEPTHVDPDRDVYRPFVFSFLAIVFHQVRQQSSSTSRCWGERQRRAEYFLNRL
jgi:hypothetical protein